VIRKSIINRAAAAAVASRDCSAGSRHGGDVSIGINIGIAPPPRLRSWLSTTRLRWIPRQPVMTPIASSQCADGTVACRAGLDAARQA